VGATGFEAGQTYGSRVADRCDGGAKEATQDDEKRRGVSASATSTDEAIRTAAKVAIDAGDLGRPRALLDLLIEERIVGAIVPFVSGRAGTR
jgi:hypothetical protein